jgi:ATP-dependent helicase/nuclease subunit A
LAQAEIIGRELPFCHEKDGAVMRGSIDLLYRDQGSLVVADYKTERVSPQELKAKKDKYAAQGQAYCQAVERAMGQGPVEFRLIFLRSPELAG